MFSPPKFESPKNSSGTSRVTTSAAANTSSRKNFNQLTNTTTATNTNQQSQSQLQQSHQQQQQHQQQHQQQQLYMQNGQTPQHNVQAPPSIQVNQFSITTESLPTTTLKQPKSTQSSSSSQAHQLYHSHRQNLHHANLSHNSFTPTHSSTSNHLESQSAHQTRSATANNAAAIAAAAAAQFADQSFQSKYLDQFGGEMSTQRYNSQSQQQFQQPEQHSISQQQQSQQQQQQQQQKQLLQQQQQQQKQQQYSSFNYGNTSNTNRTTSQFQDLSPIHHSQLQHSTTNQIHHNHHVLQQQQQQQQYLSQVQQPFPSQFTTEYQQALTAIHTSNNSSSTAASGTIPLNSNNQPPMYSQGQLSGGSHSSYLMHSNMNINMNSCGCSDGSWQLVRDQLRQIKQLSSEHLYAVQESKRFKDLNEDLNGELANSRSQIVVLEQKLILYEKENASKLQVHREKIRALEAFNKDLFTKVNLYEAAIANYESELKALAAQNNALLQAADEEKMQLKASIDSLHETMNETLAENEQKYKAKIETKNQKIKSYKQQISTDNDLIESYETELAQLQTENKLLKDDLLSLQSNIASFQAEQQHNHERIQVAESEIQTTVKASEDYRRKFEDTQSQLTALLQMKQSDGDEQFKRYQSMNQAQFQEIMHENSELQVLVSDYHHRCVNSDLEITNVSNMMHTALNALLVLIDSKGREEVDIDATLNATTGAAAAASANNVSSSSVGQAVIASSGQGGMHVKAGTVNPAMSANSYALFHNEVFEELREKVLHLIASKHSLKKKKKTLLAKNEELKDTVSDLKSTLHQVVSERQEEIIYNETQQLQYQMISQQQQQQQQSQQQQQQQYQQRAGAVSQSEQQYFHSEIQNRFEDEQQVQQQHFQRPQSANALNSAQSRNPLRASIQPTSASGLLHSSNWLEDPTLAQNSNTNGQSQFISFQQQQQIVSGNGAGAIQQQFNTSEHHQRMQSSLQQFAQQNENTRNSRTTVNSSERQVNSEEQQNRLYQQKIEEILQLQNMNHAQVIEDLRRSFMSRETAHLCLIYALSKVIQKLFMQLTQVRRYVAQSTEIVFSYINNYKRYSLEAGSAYMLKKHVRSIIFIRRLQQRVNSTKERERESTEALSSIFSNSDLFRLNTMKEQLQLSVGEDYKNNQYDQQPVMRIVSRINDLKFDVDMFTQIRQILGVPSYSSENSAENVQEEQYQQQQQQREINFPEEEFTQIARAIFNTESANRDASIEYSVIHEESILFKSAESERERLQKEKEVIESDNVQLKTLIVNLHEQNEELQRSKAKLSDHYKMVLNQYELKIMELQQENENHLENNSKLVDSMDPKSRQFLAQQSVLAGLQLPFARADELSATDRAIIKQGRSHSQHSQTQQQQQQAMLKEKQSNNNNQ